MDRCELTASLGDDSMIDTDAENETRRDGVMHPFEDQLRSRRLMLLRDRVHEREQERYSRSP